jgi:hypothetical protein
MLDKLLDVWAQVGEEYEGWCFSETFFYLFLGSTILIHSYDLLLETFPRYLPINEGEDSWRQMGNFSTPQSGHSPMKQLVPFLEFYFWA